MENVLYNDLIRRGMDVDVGVVELATRDNEGGKSGSNLKLISW